MKKNELQKIAQKRNIIHYHQSLQFIEISKHWFSLWQMTSITVFFLHSSPVSNNSSGLASLCPGSEHHLLTSSDISFQAVLSHEFSAHLSCPCQEVSMSSSNPCLDALLLALFFVPFCIWTCSIVSALLSVQVSLLRTPHRTLSLSGSPHTGSNWLKAIRLQIWQDCSTGSDHWLWYSPVSGCGSTTRQPAFTPSYINSLIVQLQKPV